MRKAGILAVALIVIAATFGTAVASAKVYYRTPYEQVVFKPKRVEFSDLTLTKLKWRHWGSKVARAKGKARGNDCIPNCAAGTIGYGTATLRIYRKKTIEGKRQYTCIKGTARIDGGKSPFQFCSYYAPSSSG
jgi:hypothetical protein